MVETATPLSALMPSGALPPGWSALGRTCPASAARPAASPAISSWARAFPGRSRHARAARGFVSSLLAMSPLRDDAVLIIAELFANALAHTYSGKPGGLVVVQVTRWLRGVRLAVTDQGSPGVPEIRENGPHAGLAENGNGLHLVAVLAGSFYWHDDASGRTTCAILGTPPPGLAFPPPGQPVSAPPGS